MAKTYKVQKKDSDEVFFYTETEYALFLKNNNLRNSKIFFHTFLMCYFSWIYNQIFN